MDDGSGVERGDGFLSSVRSFSIDSFTASLSDYQNELRQDWHSHEDFVLTMPLMGYVRERVGCRDVLVNPFDVGIKSPGIRHTDHFWSKGVRVVKVTLAESFVSELKSKLLIQDRWEWTTGTPAPRSFLRLTRFLLNNEKAEDLIFEEVCEILAALLPVKTNRFSDVPLWLSHAEEHLNSSYADGVRLTHLAHEAKIHPVYFARQFKRFFGCSVGRYIRKLQFRAVVSLIGDRQNSLSDIAYQTGFSDQAHLTRTFAAEFGMPPGFFRTLLK